MPTSAPRAFCERQLLDEPECACVSCCGHVGSADGFVVISTRLGARLRVSADNPACDLRCEWRASIQQFHYLEWISDIPDKPHQVGNAQAHQKKIAAPGTFGASYGGYRDTLTHRPSSSHVVRNGPFFILSGKFPPVVSHRPIGAIYLDNGVPQAGSRLWATIPPSCMIHCTRPTPCLLRRWAKSGTRFIITL